MIRKIKKIGVRDLKDEGIEGLLHFSYDQLADGGRYSYQSRKIDPEIEASLRRLFNIWSVETINASSKESVKLALTKVNEKNSTQALNTQGETSNLSDRDVSRR